MSSPGEPRFFHRGEPPATARRPAEAGLPAGEPRFFHRGEPLPDPWRTLGLAPGASEDEVQARYRERVRACPPERDPEAFRRLEEARRYLVGPDRIAHRLTGGVAPLDPALLSDPAGAPEGQGPSVDDELLLYALVHTLPFA